MVNKNKQQVNKRYWLKGGIIGEIFAIIIIIITYAYYEVYSNLGSFFGINEYIVGNISNYSLGLLLYVSLNLTEYFLLGALIGYIYGKIKRKTK